MGTKGISMKRSAQLEQIMVDVAVGLLDAQGVAAKLLRPAHGVELTFPPAMRVYLDVELATPPGWVRVFWPDEAIALLETGEVDELSLDHDLGDDQRGTAYDVVLWVEEAVALAWIQAAK